MKINSIKFLLIISIYFISCELNSDPPGYPYYGNVHELNTTVFGKVKSDFSFRYPFHSNFIISDQIMLDSFVKIHSITPLSKVNFNSQIVTYFRIFNDRQADSKLSFFIDHNKKEVFYKHEKKEYSDPCVCVLENKLLVFPKPPQGYKFIHLNKTFQF